MVARFRFLVVALIGAIVVAVLFVPAADAKAAPVPRVTGLAAGASSTLTAKLTVKWKKVTGATYQVRWGSSTKGLAAFKPVAVKTTSAVSPALSNICITWYAQVRAKKGTKYGAWSAAKALRFSVGSVKVPTPVTTGQTSTSQAQVRWVRSAGAAGYRLDWSPAPFGNWPGLQHIYTPYTSPTATGTAVNLPAAGPSDHFVNSAFGNPIFAQLDVKRCDGSFVHSPYFPVYAKAPSAGSAATGSPLRFGSYNVELVPTGDTPKMAALANNIASANLDVVALQEASSQTATDLIAKLNSAEGQTDWATCGKGQQQVMFRTSKWTQVSCDDIGSPVDGTAGVPSDAAKTPLPSPGVRLTPAVADPARSDIFVGSIHLEDRKKFDSSTTIPQQKQDAHDAAVALMASIDSHNPDGLPVLVAGDFKGNFGGGGQPAGAGYCDESSTPACVGEGQPTFIRAGYLDSRAAETRIGAEYASVNGHQGTQSASSSGVGSRADFIVVKGFTGVSRYVNVFNKMYSGLPSANNGTPTDHNLLYADLFIPFK